MAPFDARSAIDGASVAPGHAGSASSNLSGRAVLAAWALSIVAHGLLFIAMVALVFPYRGSREADLPLAHTDIIGSLETPSLARRHLPNLATPKDPNTSDALKFRPKELEQLSELATTIKRPELSIIGIGAGGGDFSRYGLRVGGELGPEFFGAGGAAARGARRIVYVVDRSGSMLDTFAYVQEELKRSISALRRSQKFHVIFFSSGKPIESPPARPVSAIRAQKERFFEFLKRIGPGGGTHPAPAMRRALAHEPDLIYFLTDGQFNRSLIDELDKLNKDRRTLIFTIAYVDRAGAELLEQIARAHGGEFKFVSEDDLP